MARSIPAKLVTPNGEDLDVTTPAAVQGDIAAGVADTVRTIRREPWDRGRHVRTSGHDRVVIPSFCELVKAVLHLLNYGNL